MVLFGGNICTKAFGLDSSFGAFQIQHFPHSPTPKSAFVVFVKKSYASIFFLFKVPTEVTRNVYCIELILLKY